MMDENFPLHTVNFINRYFIVSNYAFDSDIAILDTVTMEWGVLPTLPQEPRHFATNQLQLCVGAMVVIQDRYLQVYRELHAGGNTFLNGRGSCWC